GGGGGAGAGAGGGGNSGTRSKGRGGRGRGGGNAGAASRPHASSAPLSAQTKPDNKVLTRTAAEDDDTASSDGEVCFICAEPIKFHSIAPCNHKTCHICGLRMRALYKTKDCPHCRTPSPFVVFTEDANKRYEDYTDADITSFDSNIGIRYTNEEIVGDTVVLLRYNCPAEDCVFAGLGWPDLHRHVRSTHHMKMCDLCTRNKKVFTHEHELFADKELEKHMRHGDDRPGAIDQTGFRGHPLCGFCGSRFYDDDKLFDHCREKHERCFICDRRDSRHPHYFVNYNALEKHFDKDHFPCLDKECLEKKFVVFESEMDLKAHQLAEHANSLSKDVRRDARVVNMSGFDYRSPYENERRGGGGGGGSGGGGREGGGPSGGRQGRGRGRDPNAEPIPQSSAQPLRRDEIAFQRQMAIHSAQSVSNRTFGGSLSTPSATTPSAPSRRGNATPASGSSRQASAAAPSAASAPALPTAELEQLSVTDIASLPPQERAVMLRHQGVIERASNLLGHDQTKMNTFREYISNFRKGTLTAPQLVDAFFSLFADTSSNALGTLVREVADLFEDKNKITALHKAWQDWRAINEDYPSLPGLGGMHGATTASSGWASAASPSPTAPAAAPNQKHSNRVLRLKNSTRAGASGPKPVTPSASSNWVASSPAVRPPASSAFPALPAASSSSSSSSAARPSWIGPNNPSSTAGRSSGPAGPSRTVPGGRPPPSSAFPALPPAQKPLTTIFGYGSGRGVRRDLGGAASNFSWGSAPGSGAASENASEKEDEDAGQSTGGKKKKGKKVLAQWG
ncbi:E3 ubiquitin-protein ligase hel2, partial [Colletotrichum tanaceti]